MTREQDVAEQKRFLRWLLATAATALLVGGFETARSSVVGRPALSSRHARYSNRVPPDLQVVVAEYGRTFVLCIKKYSDATA